MQEEKNSRKIVNKKNKNLKLTSKLKTLKKIRFKTDLLSRAVLRNHLQFLVTSVLSNELIGGFRWAPKPVQSRSIKATLINNKIKIQKFETSSKFKIQNSKKTKINQSCAAKINPKWKKEMGFKKNIEAIELWSDLFV